MMNFYIENSHDYAAEVAMWCEKLNNLMKAEKHAAVALVAYMLPGQCTMVGCPLGDSEFEKLGEGMRTNPAMFAAAEMTGLLAEGINAFCYAALDNAGSWSCCSEDIKYILNEDELRKYVTFSDRYMAECFLTGGAMLCEFENEDLWLRYARAARKKLDERNRRGYAY